MNTLNVFEELGLSKVEKREWRRQQLTEIVEYHKENILNLTYLFEVGQGYDTSTYLRKVTVEIRGLSAAKNGYETWSAMMKSHGSVEAMEDEKAELLCHTQDNFSFAI